ncbi:hypothetical protein [Bradyrhizobium sp. CCBAU 51765]|uniref:hypothetical protein n=1 Tax=Bradyrhizobium sp. CCBAU 51765 TaxID=1325102 RepID=UPI001887258D|nr:hypothetical protein [Bradyrhizobium sp. CCBAU 51765]
METSTKNRLYGIRQFIAGVGFDDVSQRSFRKGFSDDGRLVQNRNENNTSLRMRVPDGCRPQGNNSAPLGLAANMSLVPSIKKTKHASAVPTRFIARSSLATLPDQTASPRAGSVWGPRETSPGSERVSR